MPEIEVGAMLVCHLGEEDGFSVLVFIVDWNASAVLRRGQRVPFRCEFVVQLKQGRRRKHRARSFGEIAVLPQRLW
jgi:hypothetical protein